MFLFIRSLIFIMRLINSTIKAFLYQSEAGYASIPISTEFPLNLISLNCFLYIWPLRKTLCLSFISYSIIFLNRYGFTGHPSVYLRHPTPGKTFPQPSPPPFLLIPSGPGSPVILIVVEKFQLLYIIITYIPRCHRYKAFQKSRRSSSCVVRPSTPLPLYRNRCTAAMNRTRPKC